MTEQDRYQRRPFTHCGAARCSPRPSHICIRTSDTLVLPSSARHAMAVCAQLAQQVVLDNTGANA